MEFRVQAETSKTRRYPLDLVYQPMWDVDGAVTGIFMEGNDITDLRNALDNVAPCEAHLRLVIETPRAPPS